MASTEIGNPAIRRRSAVACATLSRFLRSALNIALATSRGHTAGTTTVAPFASRSSIPSVTAVASSSKPHATATEASKTSFLNCLMVAPLLYQLPDLYLSESHTLSELTDVTHNIPRILCFPRIGGDKLSPWNPPQRDLNRFPPRNPLQQCVEVRLGVESTPRGPFSPLFSNQSISTS